MGIPINVCKIGGHMAQTWIPKFIHKESEYKSQQIVTADDYNAYLNLLIAQGDYNSEWLNWLTTEGIIEQLTDISGEDIQQAIIDAAQDQIDQLVSDSKNKTSAHLNTPVFTFLDSSATTTALTIFKPALTAHSALGCLACYSSLVGSGTPYMTNTDLQAAQIDGFQIVNHGINKSAVTDANVNNVVTTSVAYMNAQGLVGSTDVFAYPVTAPTSTVRENIKSKFTSAIGHVPGVIDTDAYDRGYLTVINLPAESTEVLDTVLEDVLTNNKWCIFRMDTSAENFDVTQLEYVLSILDGEDLITITTVSDAAQLAASTINNKIVAVNNRIDALIPRIVVLEQKLQSINSIKYGSKTNGLPSNPSEGDIYIMY